MMVIECCVNLNRLFVFMNLLEMQNEFENDHNQGRFQL